MYYLPKKEGGSRSAGSRRLMIHDMHGTARRGQIPSDAISIPLTNCIHTPEYKGVRTRKLLTARLRLSFSARTYIYSLLRK